MLTPGTSGNSLPRLELIEFSTMGGERRSQMAKTEATGRNAPHAPLRAGCLSDPHRFTTERTVYRLRVR